MFNVSKPELENRTFRMPKALIERLNKVAQEKDVSLNRLVVLCCEYALNDMPDEDEPKTK